VIVAGCGGDPQQQIGTEVWTIVRPDGAQARVTILGGAIQSDGMPQWTVLDNSTTCPFPTPNSSLSAVAVRRPASAPALRSLLGTATPS
jgi:hypothetical protein